MTVISHSSVLYTVEDGATKWQVALLPGAVAVYGDHGKQYFSNPLNLPAKRLKEAFPNEAVLRKSANLDTLSAVDLRKLLASVERAFNAKSINQAELKRLQELFHRCDCTPEAIKRKVEGAGFGRILHLLVIEDHNPALDATVNALQTFLRELG